jgi:hypothetical protein
MITRSQGHTERLAFENHTGIRNATLGQRLPWKEQDARLLNGQSTEDRWKYLMEVGGGAVNTSFYTAACLTNIGTASAGAFCWTELHYGR